MKVITVVVYPQALEKTQCANTVQKHMLPLLTLCCETCNSLLMLHCLNMFKHANSIS